MDEINKELIEKNKNQWISSNKIESEGLEWLYNDPTIQNNNQLELYLLGKSIPGSREELKKLDEKSIGSLLNTEETNLYEQTLNKFREDPLYIIKKLETQQQQIINKYTNLNQYIHNTSTKGEGASTVREKNNSTKIATTGKGANFTAMECTPGKGANFTAMESRDRSRERTRDRRSSSRDKERDRYRSRRIRSRDRDRSRDKDRRSLSKDRYRDRYRRSPSRDRHRDKDRTRNSYRKSKSNSPDRKYNKSNSPYRKSTNENSPDRKYEENLNKEKLKGPEKPKKYNPMKYAFGVNDDICPPIEILQTAKLKQLQQEKEQSKEQLEQSKEQSDEQSVQREHQSVQREHHSVQREHHSVEREQMLNEGKLYIKDKLDKLSNVNITNDITNITNVDENLKEEYLMKIKRKLFENTNLSNIIKHKIHKHK
ncbi:uncharacterized protein TA09635 [Theileria annulata]|uniref:Pre-mRNA splicing factor n=1 Tax=Theileria annulata TaxID=5874 RepID=Q4UJ37_THEAN|nr:uncharacterized protein TA09635 [Theileria annulata]CAI72902.1 hypothetical protein, conserved [Theileria annulata]|eukprot:XP_953580.1 hypothetical protein, conserved [Theileria annulata]